MSETTGNTYLHLLTPHKVIICIYSNSFGRYSRWIISMTILAEALVHSIMVLLKDKGFMVICSLTLNSNENLQLTRDDSYHPHGVQNCSFYCRLMYV